MKNMNKKGSLFDMLYLIIIMLVFAMTVFLGYKIMIDYNENAADLLTTEESVNAMNNGELALTNMDYIFIVLIIGDIIAMIIGAFLLKSHPAFFFAALFFLALLIFLAATMSNIFETFSEEEQFSDEVATEFPIIIHMMESLPKFVLIGGAFVLLVLFVKEKFGGGVG